MAWTKTKIIKSTDNNDIITATAIWTDPNDSAITFKFTKERIDITSTGAKATFVSEAKAALQAWQDEKTPTTAESNLLTSLNA